MQALRRSLALAALAGGMLVTPAPDVPGASGVSVAPPVIQVVSADSGFTISGPSTARAGVVTVRFVNRSSPTNINPGSDIALVKLRSGVTLTRLFADLRPQAGPLLGPPTPASLRAAAASTRALLKDAQFFGGAALEQPGQSADVTEVLSAGTYQLVNMNDVFGRAARPLVRTISVTGSAVRVELPAATARIDLTAANRFVTSGTLRAGGGYLVRNVSSTLHFVQFLHVRPGTTEAQLARAVTAPGQPSFVLPGGVEHEVLGPGGQTVFRSPGLKPGTYALLCLVADARTGMAHAVTGMRTIVVLR
jgi:hypothetical protein